VNYNSHILHITFFEDKNCLIEVFKQQERNVNVLVVKENLAGKKRRKNDGYVVIETNRSTIKQKNIVVDKGSLFVLPIVTPTQLRTDLEFSTTAPIINSVLFSTDKPSEI
jgi:hypothetical protein